MRVLLVEDDPGSADLIDAALRAEGIICKPAKSGEDAIDLVKHYEFQAMILGVRLPDIDGFEVLRQVRAIRLRTPVLFLSETNETEDKVRALTMGADDCLSKPFNKSELIARLHAIVRRSKGHPASVIKAGKLVVNLDTRSVDVDGRRLHLTSKEYSTLELLSLCKGTTLTKEVILHHLYGGIDEPQLRMIDVFVSKLRRKIAVATGGSHYIETVWGQGYVLKDQDGYSSPDERRASEYAGEAIALIESSLKAGGARRYALSDEDAELLINMRAQIIILKLLVQAGSAIRDDVGIVEPQLRRLNQLAMSLYQVVNAKILSLNAIQEKELSEHEIVEGNVVRRAGSRGFEDGKFRTDPWISGQGFSGDSFNAIADLAKCLQHSQTGTHKALCNLAFVLEILRTMASVVAQMIPFAPKK